jgi:hypothetical protein
MGELAGVAILWAFDLIAVVLRAGVFGHCEVCCSAGTAGAGLNSAETADDNRETNVATPTTPQASPNDTDDP